MTTRVYATRQDLDDFGGLPDGALSNEGRVAASIAPSTDTIELLAHGFQTGSPLTVRAAEGGTIAAPLVAGTTYYAIRTSDDAFKLSATVSGSAIDITTAGANVIVAKMLPVDRMLEAYSRWVDDCLPAHLVPVLPDVNGVYPILIVKMVAQLAGVDLLHRGGKESDVVKTAALEAKAQLDRWAAGRPLRDTRITSPANLAVTTTLGAAADQRGWGSGTLP